MSSGCAQVVPRAMRRKSVPTVSPRTDRGRWSNRRVVPTRQSGQEMPANASIALAGWLCSKYDLQGIAAFFYESWQPDRCGAVLAPHHRRSYGVILNCHLVASFIHSCTPSDEV